MSVHTTRRSVLLGGAAAVAGVACQPRLGQRESGVAAAFPTLPGGRELLGPQPGEVRLHSNENPYGPSKSALRMMDYAARKGAYYADDASKTLSAMIAERHGLTPEHILISAGSAEALSAIALLWGQRGPILGPRLFFDATPIYAARLGFTTLERTPMTPDLHVDFAALEARVSDNTGLVQICNPNNPTGLLEDPEILKPSVVRMSAKTTVVVDEAYMELTDQPEQNSCIDLVHQGHDVIVSRTFSKLYGLAGIRVGYVIAPPEHIRLISSAVMSWMSGVSYAAAIGCYEDEAFIRRSRAKIFEARQMVNETLARLGMTALVSDANFIYFRSGQDANVLQQTLAAQNINIRGQYMDYNEWSRVSMGLLPDVAKFCRALPAAAGV